MSFFTKLEAFIRRVIGVETAAIRTNTVCQVVSYNNLTNLANLQPCIESIVLDDPDSPAKQLPEVHDIPVFQFGGGEVVVTSAPAAGSYGLYVVSDRNIQNWILRGGIVPPAGVSRFDLSNGFFLGGIFPTIVDGDNGALVVPIETDRVSIRTRNGLTEVSVLSNGNIEVTTGVAGTMQINSDVDAVALASKVDDFISRFDAVMKAWVPAPPDGGAALSVAYKLAFGHAPPVPALNPKATASAKLKIDS